MSPGCASLIAACRSPPAGTVIVPPDDDGGGTLPPPPGPVATATDARFVLPVSNRIVICCVPAPSETGTFTVVHDCQSPVGGTETLAHTLLVLLNPRCSEPPYGDATRSWAV